jgi:glycerol-3-phosphate dehydrogenase
LEKAFNISAETVARLKNIYGRRSREILELVRQDNQLQEIFDEESGAIAAEIVFAVRNEMAQTLAECGWCWVFVWGLVFCAEHWWDLTQLVV